MTTSRPTLPSLRPKIPVWLIAVLGVGVLTAGVLIFFLRHDVNRNTDNGNRRDGEISRLADDAVQARVDARRAHREAVQAQQAAAAQRRLVQALQDQVRRLCGERSDQTGCTPLTAAPTPPAPAHAQASSSGSGGGTPAPGNPAPSPRPSRSPAASARPSASPTPRASASPSTCPLPICIGPSALRLPSPFGRIVR